jgi:NAD(P)-dependent dehydrogenase (short-subunit alcohol dehydrogenase family)
MRTPYEKTVDGLELQFASNHINNFLFTNLIIHKLLEAPAPRVVSVSSVGHFWGPVRFEVCVWPSLRLYKYNDDH